MNSSVMAMNIKSLVTWVWALLRKEPLASIALLISLASIILTLLTNAAVWASSDIRDLIAEEAKVSVTGDVEKAVSLYTEDALIRDWGNWDANAKTHLVQSWQGVRDIRERYKTLPRYRRLLHVDVNIEELQLLEGAARAKSSTDGIMLWDGTTPTIVASIDGDIWEFKKVNRHPFIPWSGEWKISSFTYNKMPREH